MIQTLFNNRKEKIKIFKERINYRLNNNQEIKTIPDNILKTCPSCNSSIPLSELDKNEYVCSICNYHFKLNSIDRINLLVDKNTFKERDKKYFSKNIDKFPGYTESLTKYKKLTGINEAVLTGTATINEQKVAIAVMDSYFMMGSMGHIVGDKITRIIEFATKHHLPLIISCASGGARMQEGILSLVQMVKTSAALKRHSDANLLYISLITHPTFGGVSASFASLGDIIIAEPLALYGFAGKRVISDTINQKLPDDFQSAEFCLESGFIDRIVERKNLKNNISTILKMHGENI
jgi:acetyl-CoA carboxylase carboxyl transferase subunit beta